MENELSLLQDLKSAIWILIYITSIYVTFFVIKTSITVYKTLKEAIEDKFYTVGSVMFDSGEYDELIQYCHNHLKKHPKEGYGYWFLGKAYYHKDEYDKAIEYFNKAAEIYPTWKKEWVEPYLQKIQDAKSTANKSLNQTGANDAPPG